MGWTSEVGAADRLLEVTAEDGAQGESQCWRTKATKSAVSASERSVDVSE